MNRALALAFDAQLAAMAAQISSMRATIAPWVELLPPHDAVERRISESGPSVCAEDAGRDSGERPAPNSPPAAAHELPSSHAAEGPVSSPVEGISKATETPGSSERRAPASFPGTGQHNAAIGRANVEKVYAAIAQLIADGAPVTNKALQEAAGLSEITVKRCVDVLVKSGRISATGATSARRIALRNAPAAAPPPALNSGNADQDAIAAFIAKNGVTRCPPAFAEPSQARTSEADRAAIAAHNAEQERRRQEALIGRGKR